MNILDIVNGMISIISNGMLWLGLVIGYIAGRKFYRPIEDVIFKAVNNIRQKGVQSNGARR